MLYARVSEFPRDGWRWRRFRPEELACRCRRFCGGEYWDDPAFLDALERVRDAVGRPLVVNSGRRCAKHNAAVGGARRSCHQATLAVDLSVAGFDPTTRGRLLRTAREEGFTGFGFGRRFLHLDRRGRPAAWEYQPGEQARWETAARL